MKPLLVLLVSFILVLFAIKFFYHKYEISFSARIAMSVMLVFTAVSHFAFTKGMEAMIPYFVPYKTEMVYLTGILELMAAVGLLVPVTRIWTGWLLILFFVLLLPANINAAIYHIDYQKGTSDGNGLSYLWFRIPLQLLFITWTYFSTIKF